MLVDLNSSPACACGASSELQQRVAGDVRCGACGTQRHVSVERERRGFPTAPSLAETAPPCPKCDARCTVRICDFVKCNACGFQF